MSEVVSNIRPRVCELKADTDGVLREGCSLVTSFAEWLENMEEPWLGVALSGIKPLLVMFRKGRA